VLKLKSISLRNWSRIRSAELVFPTHGLVHVQGPYGAGKTSLGEAINRTLLGSGFTPHLLDYSYDKQGDMYVDLRTELHGTPLRVELGYACPEFPDADGEGLRYTYGEETTERPKARQTRDELSALLGVSPEVSLWTLFLDGERLKFKSLSQAAALDLLMQALNQPPWEAFKERADRRRETAQAEVAQKSARLAQLQSTREATSRELDEATKALIQEKALWADAQAAWADAVEAHRKDVLAAAEEVTAAEENRAALKKQIIAVQKADAEKFGQLELELTRLTSEHRTADVYLQGWREALTQLESDARHAQNHLTLLSEGKSCPTCRQAVQTKADAITVKKAEQALVLLRRKITETTEGRNECRTCLDDLNREISEIRVSQRTLQSERLGPLSRELELSETTLARAARRLQEHERAAPPAPVDAAVRQAETLLAERQRRAAAHQLDVERAAAELAAAEHRLLLIRYWCKGFSPEGIPNLVLRQTVDPLNAAARLISETMSGGRVQVSFAADTELASGLLKPKLTTQVRAQRTQGSTSLPRPSKGEAGLVNLIIAETQTQVGRVLARVGFRWCDELLNHVGASVRQSVYSHLKRQASEQQLLTFIVDHHPEVAGLADHVLTVAETSDGYSEFKW
jgi:DNA repair exonuclease SbcCD ATPase subunit